MFSKPSPTAELYAAARTGNIENVKNVLSKHKELKPDRGTLAAAIKSGSTPLVIYFREEHKLIPKSGVMEAVDEAKSFEMAQYLLNTYPELKFTIDHTITWAAARTGNLDMLKFFLQRKFLLRADQGTLYDAVRGGNPEMVKYLVNDYGISDISEAHELAKNSGKTEIADFFQECTDRPKIGY
jgi:hypothetical protein